MKLQGDHGMTTPSSFAARARALLAARRRAVASGTPRDAAGRIFADELARIWPRTDGAPERPPIGSCPECAGLGMVRVERIERGQSVTRLARCGCRQAAAVDSSGGGHGVAARIARSLSDRKGKG